MGTHITRRRAVIGLSMAALVGCALPVTTVPVPVTVAPGSASDVTSYARVFLNAIQPISYSESREYCGFFVETPGGGVVATDPRAGTPDSCNYGLVPETAIASYHTHGGYLPNYLNEIPSVTDALSATDIGMDDYVSTPGGRFWLVDGDTGTATMICGQGCLSTDPIFEATRFDPDARSYTLSGLKAFQLDAAR